MLDFFTLRWNRQFEANGHVTDLIGRNAAESEILLKKIFTGLGPVWV